MKEGCSKERDRNVIDVVSVLNEQAKNKAHHARALIAKEGYSKIQRYPQTQIENQTFAYTKNHCVGTHARSV